MMQEAPSFWYDLPTVPVDFANAAAFARRIGWFENEAMVRAVFERFPILTGGQRNLAHHN